MISILAYLLPFKHIGYILPSSLFSFLSTRVIAHDYDGYRESLPNTYSKALKLSSGGTPAQNSDHRGLSRNMQSIYVASGVVWVQVRARSSWDALLDIK